METSEQPLSLLATKLYIPRARGNLVARPALTNRLNAGLARKLTLISAPAGFGKTTLLTAWIAQADRPVAWLSFDEADNDPLRFLTYVIAALQTIYPDLGQTILLDLQSAESAAFDELLIRLVNELVAVPNEFVLAFEDYHLIQEPSIHSLVAFLLEHLPPPCHLIITSRADPPLPLARLRVRGELTELRANDLRFTRQEITDFFSQTQPIPLATADLATLEARTEGWAAGLQLAALSIQGKQAVEVSTFVKAFAGDHRYVLDYLVEEVLHQQPAPIQTFLLHTSVLNRLSGPLCEALLETGDGRFEIETKGYASGQEILEQLEVSNLFLVALDGQRIWYRYHRLFADFLRERLLRQIGQPEVATLYRRASAWCEDNDLLEEAITYTLAAEDWARAVQLVEQVATWMWQAAHYSAIKRWLETLPPEVLSASPQLCLWYAWALVLYGQFQAYKQPLQIAEQTWQVEENLAKLGQVFHVRTLAAYLQRDSAAILDNAQHALAYLDETHFMRELDRCFQAMGYLFAGQIATAQQRLLALQNERSAIRAPRLPLIIQSGLGEIKQHQGRLPEAIKIWQDINEVAGDRNPLLPIRLLGFLGELYYEQNDLAQAEAALQQSFEVAHRADRDIFALWSYVTWARLLWLTGQPTEALASLDRALSLVQNLDYPLPRRHLTAWRVRLQLAQGDVEAAEVWLADTGLAVDDDPAYPRQVEYLTLVRLLLAQAQPEQALHCLNRLLEAAEATGRLGDTVEMLALKALAHQADNAPDQAQAALAQALTLGQAGGYVRTFVDEGRPMAELLTTFPHKPAGVSQDYLNRLLSAFDLPSVVPPPQSEIENRKPKIQNLIEPLSERELEVLRLIVEGATNREVAQALVITVNTVKKHTTNIYGKLGVSNRLQAVTKARALNLL